MPRDADAERLAAWSRYWQDGNLSSCGEAAGGGTADWAWPQWQQVFDGSPPGGTIIELGCGNGALLRRAADMLAARGTAVRLAGYDRAAIAPVAAPPGLALHGGVDMAHLPLADGCADRVICQYALEYADWRRTAGEIMRILRPGGRFLLLVHVRESRIVSRAARQAAALAAMLDLGLPAALDRAMRALAAAATDPAPPRLAAARDATLALADRLNALDHLRRDTESGALASAALDAVRAAPRGFERMAAADAVAAARDLVERIRGQLVRFRDLDRAALDPPALDELARCLADRGAVDVTLRQALAPTGPGTTALAGMWIAGGRAAD